VPALGDAMEHLVHRLRCLQLDASPDIALGDVLAVGGSWRAVLVGSDGAPVLWLPTVLLCGRLRVLDVHGHERIVGRYLSLPLTWEPRYATWSRGRV